MFWVGQDWRHSKDRKLRSRDELLHKDLWMVSGTISAATSSMRLTWAPGTRSDPSRHAYALGGCACAAGPAPTFPDLLLFLSERRQRLDAGGAARGQLGRNRGDGAQPHDDGHVVGRRTA